MKAFTLARLKAIAAFVGAMLTFATTLDWGFALPTWVTAAAALLTAAAVYAVPNIQPGTTEVDLDLPDVQAGNSL